MPLPFQNSTVNVIFILQSKESCERSGRLFASYAAAKYL